MRHVLLLGLLAAAAVTVLAAALLRHAGLMPEEVATASVQSPAAVPGGASPGEAASPDAAPEPVIQAEAAEPAPPPQQQEPVQQSQAASAPPSPGGPGQVLRQLLADLAISPSPRGSGQAKPAPPSVQAEPAPSKAKLTPDAAGQPGPRIVMPPRLRGIEFGTSAQVVAQRFPPAWRRETQDALTLVHHVDQARTAEVRFDFGAQGLQRIEVRFTAADREPRDALYENLKAQYSAAYGRPSGGSDATWSDGRVVAGLAKGRDYVALTFSLRQ
jgi:hypothetical protein